MKISNLALAAALVAPAAPGTAQTAATAAAAAGTALPRSAGGVVQVDTGRGRLVTLARPMSDLFIADDKIADVQVRSPTQLYIFGKATGETTVSATNKAGAVVYATTVRVGNNYGAVGSMLALAMPDAKIVATPMNGLVLLTGTVAAPDDAAEAERLVQAFVGEGTKVLSRLRTATPLQVNLQVRFAEVARSFIKNVGSNLTTIDGTGGFKFGIGSGRSPAGSFTTDRNLPLGIGGAVQGYTIDPITNQLVRAPGTSITPGAEQATVGFLTKALGLNVLGALDLGETIGQVTLLANPNLTALSGETGTFLAGGEIPIPLAQGLGTIGVTYKQYGVSLSYTPTVLADGRISLRVRPEVSQLDYANAVVLAGTRVPGLTSRRAETTVELGSGQSLVIGGLLQNNNSNTIAKTPGIGDLPILGTLFRSNGWQRQETELVIVITPYLVKPVDNQSDIALPTDGYRQPTDLGRILLGEIGSGRSGEPRPVPTLAPPPTPVPGTPPVGAVAPVAIAPAASVKGAASTKGKAALPAPGFSK